MTLNAMLYFFDKLAILWFGKLWDSNISVNVAPEIQPMMPEWDWLREQGFLCDPKTFVGAEIIQNFWELSSLVNSMLSLRKNWPSIELKACRKIATDIRAQGDSDAVAFSVCRQRNALERVELGTSTVAHVVLRNLPQPDDYTPWQDIFEFRNDPDVKGKFYRFKNWMNQFATNGRSVQEIEDQINEMLYEYQQHLKLHRIKAQPGVLETFITVGAEIAESLITLKWSKAAKTLFLLKYRKAALLEAEVAAPGREITYLATTLSQFIKRPQ